MTTITIQPQPDNGALQLSITTLETITAITRSDANGVADVRTLPGLLPWKAPRAVDAINYATNAWPTSATGWGTSSGYVKSYESAGRFGRSKTMLYTKSGGGGWIVYGRRGGSAGSGASSTQPDGMDELAPCTQGQTVYARLDMGTDQAQTEGKLVIRFFDAAYADLGGNASATTPMQVNTWQTFTHNAVAPAGAVGWWLEFSIGYVAGGPTNTVGGELAWASRCVLGPSGTYFDGGTPDTDIYEYSYDVGTNPISFRSVAGADLIVPDYEAASGPVTYTAGNDTESVTWDLGSPWLFVPVMPAYSVELKSLLEYSAGGSSLGSVHELLGREDPVAVLRGMSTRTGTLRVYCGTFAEAVTVVEACKRGEVLMLRQPEHEGMDMYFTATSYSIPTLDARGSGSVFGVDIGYIQLARPTGDLSGSLGWTFASLAAAYPTFAALAKAYATFQDVLLNEPK